MNTISKEYAIFNGPPKVDVFNSFFYFYSKNSNVICRFELIAKYTVPPDDEGAPYLKDNIDAQIRDVSYEDGSGDKLVIVAVGMLQGEMREIKAYYDTRLRKGNTFSIRTIE